MTEKTSPQDDIDPRGLIRDAYAMEIGASECRSIFLDWAIGVPIGEDTRARILALLDRWADTAPDHPMTAVLREGLGQAGQTGRRGGRRGRLDGG